MPGIPFVKGHGTENDFVLLPDLDAALDVSPARVRALCDRRRGLGADGVLRVVRDGGWFMDYRNADGSVAEMCGNGARVFARYLVDSGLETAAGFVLGTRAGPRPVEVHPDGLVTVHMGQVRVSGRSAATVSTVDYPGVAVDVGNPHLVCLLGGAGPGLDELDLTVPPGHDEALFPNGVNVEFVVPDGADRVRMRVHERGVGETRSCGTGTVAVAAAVLGGAGKLTVDVPGGRVRVTADEHGSTLTGPAVLTARGELDPEWWATAG